MTPEETQKTQNSPEGKSPAVTNKEQTQGNASSGKTGEADQTNKPKIKHQEDLPSEKWLWVDPFVENAELNKRLDSGAVLLAEDIVRYVSYNLLIDKQDFASGEAMGAKLKGASYTMTPDPDEGWMINEENKLVKLQVEEDPAGSYFVVPKHSLVFIRLKQRLRVPFYMIGRHNLKITYVYQGLLLGTGPQVDPGYVGNLYIPLHNFTTREAHIYLKKSFVSIDFVRTSPLSFDHGVPASLDELYEKYGKTKWLFDLKKLKERAQLTDYLMGEKPQSAMVEFLHHYKETLKELQQTKEDTKNAKQQQETRANIVDARLDSSQTWNRIESIVVAGILVTSVIAMVAFIHQSNEETRSIVSESLSSKLLLMENNTISAQEQQKTMVRNMQTELSNSLSSFSVTQELIVKDQFEAGRRLKAIEAYVFGVSNKMVDGTSTNPIPFPKQ